eukprot:1220872-Prymnesium_polylepis.1
MTTHAPRRIALSGCLAVWLGGGGGGGRRSWSTGTRRRASTCGSSPGRPSSARASGRRTPTSTHSSARAA